MSDSDIPPNGAAADRIVQGLWIGPQLSAMEQLSIASFLANGHQYHLYVYGEVRNVPPGAMLCNAEEILPADWIFQDNRGTFCSFANFFRYKLLLEKGGWWVDLDIICLRHFDFEQPYVFMTEADHLGNAVIRVPAASGLMSYLWEICRRVDRRNVKWGATGPLLLQEAVRGLRLSAFAVDPQILNPIDWRAWRTILDPSQQWTFGQRTRSIHLWNEMWRLGAADKNGSYPADCLYEILKKRYLGPARPSVSGPQQAVSERSMQLLGCEFSVVSDCDELVAALDDMLPRAWQRFPVSRRHLLEAWRREDGYDLSEDGRALAKRVAPRSAADFLVERMHQTAVGVLDEYTKIHAGCATWRGKRFVAIGPARSGKTTLMTRLLYEGFDVHCDDLVLLRRGDVLPYPKLFRVRRNALHLLPQLSPSVRERASGRDHLPLDPVRLGFAWRVEPAPPTVVFFLERNHSGATKREVCPRIAMAERIMSHSNGPAGGAREWLEDVRRLVESATPFVLTVGDLDMAVGAIKAALSEAEAI